METFGVGKVLATGFRIWLRNIVPFTLLAALIYLPMVIWGVSTVQGELGLSRLDKLVQYQRYSLVVGFLEGILLSAALTYGVVMELMGQRASIGDCITTGLRRFFPVLGVGVLSTLCIALGIVALIIPGLIVACALYVAMPVAVLERAGVGGALSRSRELTRGHRWGIFGLLLVLALLSYGLNQAVVSLTLTPALGDPARFFAALPNYVYGSLAVLVIYGSISAVMASVAYYFLRAEKEGTSAAELAAIFD